MLRLCILLALLSLAQCGLPTVSIIMPTNSRPEFVEHAIDSISRQDYPKGLLKEVVIVDDSPFHLRVPGLQLGSQRSPKTKDMNVVYVVLETPMSIGAKRNIALRYATGDVVSHFDDDDFYSPQRLQHQIQPIANGQADITLLEHQFTYFMSPDKLHQADKTWGPHFGTLTYKRALFSPAGNQDQPGMGAAIQYPDNSEGEDWTFAQLAVEKGASIQVLDSIIPGSDIPIFTCVRHGSNTWEWMGSGNKFDKHSTSISPERSLSKADRTFAGLARTSQIEGSLLDQVQDRRLKSPAPNRFKSNLMNPNFFGFLFQKAEGERRSGGGRRSGGQPPCPNPNWSDWSSLYSDTISYMDLTSQMGGPSGSQSGYYGWAVMDPTTGQPAGLPGAVFNSSNYVSISPGVALSDTFANLAKVNLSDFFVVKSEPSSPDFGNSGPTGGDFTATDAQITLTKHLVLPYYTKLKVAALDLNGYNVQIGAYALLEADSITGSPGSISIDPLAAGLSVSGDVSVAMVDMNYHTCAFVGGNLAVSNVQQSTYSAIRGYTDVGQASTLNVTGDLTLRGDTGDPTFVMLDGSKLFVGGDVRNGALNIHQWCDAEIRGDLVLRKEGFPSGNGDPAVVKTGAYSTLTIGGSVKTEGVTGTFAEGGFEGVTGRFASNFTGGGQFLAMEGYSQVSVAGNFQAPGQLQVRSKATLTIGGDLEMAPGQTVFRGCDNSNSRQIQVVGAWIGVSSTAYCTTLAAEGGGFQLMNTEFNTTCLETKRGYQDNQCCDGAANTVSSRSFNPYTV